MTITDDALKAAVSLSTRYISDRFLPDKAIDLIDEAASRVRLKDFAEPEEIQSLEKEISRLEIQRELRFGQRPTKRQHKLRRSRRKRRVRLKPLGKSGKRRGKARN